MMSLKIDEYYEHLIAEFKKISEGLHVLDEEIKKAFAAEYCNKNTFYVREGEIPHKIGYVVKGLMKYYYIDNDGNEWIKYFAAENDFVASYASFLYKTPSLYYIEAIEDSIVFSINHDTYMNHIARSQVWCTIARKYTEKIYYEKEKREASLLKESGSERYSNFLSEYKHLSDRISLKDTALFLGLTPVSLSRIRNNKQGGINKC